MASIIPHEKQIINKLKIMISEDLDVDIRYDEIDEDISLFEEGMGLDSIAIVEFIVLIEKNYEFSFKDDELKLEYFNSLNTLSHFILQMLLDKKLARN